MRTWLPITPLEEQKAFPFGKMIRGMPDPERSTFPVNHLCVPFLELTQDIAQHFFVFQAEGKENCFQWPGMGHVKGGREMEFGPVEKAIKGLLIFFAQPLSKLLPLPCSFSKTKLKGITVQPIIPPDDIGAPLRRTHI